MCVDVRERERDQEHSLRTHVKDFEMDRFKNWVLGVFLMEQEVLSSTPFDLTHQGLPFIVSEGFTTL